MRYSLCHLAGGIVFIVAFSTTSFASDLSQTGPQASAAQIIAAHGPVESAVLRLTFSKSVDGATARSLLVDIASNYVLVRNPGGSTLTDYSLKREIFIEDTKKTFANLSLYAAAEQHYAEAYNRRYLRQMLAKVGVANAPQEMRNPFWAQQELGVVDPADGKVDIVQTPAKSGGTQFTTAGEVVASYTPSDAVLSQAERSGFSRFLYSGVSLHPHIIDAVLANGAVPKELSYVTVVGGKRQSVRLTLSSVERLTATYPLAAEYTNQPLREDTTDPSNHAVASELPVMLAAVSGKAPGMHTLSDYGLQIDNALKHDNQFQVLLTFLEMNLQYGQGAGVCGPAQAEGCHASSVLADAAKKEPRGAQLLQAFAVERSDPGKAITLEQNIDRKGVVNAYVIDDLIGNTLVEAGRDQEAIRLFDNAIHSNPYLAGYYKDFGDLFRKAFRADLAWLFYDLGRVLPGGPNAPVIATINQYEDFLEKKVPQFF